MPLNQNETCQNWGDELAMMDGVAMKGKRVIIPEELQQEAVELM